MINMNVLFMDLIQALSEREVCETWAKLVKKYCDHLKSDTIKFYIIDCNINNIVYTAYLNSLQTQCRVLGIRVRATFMGRVWILP